MYWIFFAAIAAYFVMNFLKDSRKVKKINISLGGMRKLYPDFVEFFEREGFELVEDSGTKLVYRKAITDNIRFNEYLFFGLESVFTLIAFAYITNGMGEKIRYVNYNIGKKCSSEDIEFIYKKLLFDINSRGY